MWESVKSSNIAMVSYDKEEKQLDIIFGKTGNQYKYLNVSLQRFNNLMKAESIGSYFAKMIRPNYKAEKVV